jgi:hypothetical protein
MPTGLVSRKQKWRKWPLGPWRRSVASTCSSPLTDVVYYDPCRKAQTPDLYRARPKNPSPELPVMFSQSCALIPLSIVIDASANDLYRPLPYKGRGSLELSRVREALVPANQLLASFPHLPHTLPAQFIVRRPDLIGRSPPPPTSAHAAVKQVARHWAWRVAARHY